MSEEHNTPSPDEIAVREVEVRAWPEQMDVSVIDPVRLVELATFRLDERPVGTRSQVFSPIAPYAVRAQAAIRHTEDDQEILRLHYGLERTGRVCLRPTPEPRRSLDGLLGEYGLSLPQVEVAELPEVVRHLARLSPTSHWELLGDWYDRVELRYPAGVSRENPDSWVNRAHPDAAERYLQLAGGDPETAFLIFRDDVDVPLQELTLYQVIAWSYFLRTEFAGRDSFPLGALVGLGLDPGDPRLA